MAQAVDASIFLVDDNDVVRDSLKILLESYGMRVQEFRTTRDFLAKADAASGDCLVLGFHRVIMDGLDLMAALHRRNIALPVIFIVGGGDETQGRLVRQSGAVAYLERPIEEAALIRAIRSAIGGNTGKSGADAIRAAESTAATIDKAQR